jgi:putative MATE family efflux protein
MPDPLPRQKTTQLDSERVGWLLVKMATPVFIGMFVQAMYNTINTIFIGRYVGTEGIAGLSIVFPLQMFAMGVGMMVGIGGVSVISRSIGAGDIPRAERALGNCFTLSLVLSIVIMLIIMPFLDFWLRLIGASDAVLPYARDYLLIVIGGTIFNTLALALLSTVRAEGNAAIGMISMVIGAVLSIILSAVFIISMKMEVAGAALATVISQVIAMLILLGYYLTGKSYLKIRSGNFAPDFQILRAMLSIGISSFVQTVASSISAMILINSIIRYGGDIALSAFGIIQRIMFFANMPAMVVGQGLQPILGFNYGARRFGLGLKSIYMAYASSTVMCLAGFAIVYLFPGPIVQVFRDDPELIEVGVYGARLAFLALPLMGLVMVSQMIFQAIGKAGRAFIVAFVRPVVFLIPAVLIMSQIWKLGGVFVSLPIADVSTFLLIVILLSPIIKEFRQASAQERREKTISITHGPLPVNSGGDGAS